MSRGVLDGVLGREKGTGEKRGGGGGVNLTGARSSVRENASTWRPGTHDFPVNPKLLQNTSV